MLTSRNDVYSPARIKFQIAKGFTLVILFSSFLIILPINFIIIYGSHPDIIVSVIFILSISIVFILFLFFILFLIIDSIRWRCFKNTTNQRYNLQDYQISEKLETVFKINSIENIKHSQSERLPDYLLPNSFRFIFEKYTLPQHEMNLWITRTMGISSERYALIYIDDNKENNQLVNRLISEFETLLNE